MATKDPLTKVNTRVRTHVEEDGTLLTKQLPLYLDPRGTASFVMRVPEYVAAALDVGSVCKAATAETVEREHAALMSRYSQHVNTAKAEPVIVVHFDLRHSHHMMTTRQAAAGVSYYLAFRVNGNLYTREVVRGDDWPKFTPKGERPGHRIRGINGTVLDYTPEVHAKLDQVIDALEQASEVLAGLQDSKSLAASLLALGSGGAPLLTPPPEEPSVLAGTDRTTSGTIGQP